MSSMREYIKFYGVWLDDRSTVWTPTTYKRHLVRDWMAYVESEPSSTWNATSRRGTCSFIYPNHLAKTYYLEGVIEGEITFGATAKSYVSNYRVTVFIHNADSTKTDLFSTGIIIPTNQTALALDFIRYPVSIDAYNAKTIGEYDRLGLKVEWNINGAASGATANLYHDYDATYGYDLWVDMPLIIPD